MNRRSALKSFLYISAGVSLLPACLNDKGKASFLLKNISIDGEQEKMLADLCETIIPKTNTPGAKDLSSHLFVLMMVDDCYKKEDQQKFVAGLKAFEATVKQKYNNPFTSCTQAQKEELLTSLGQKLKQKKDAPVDADAEFYGITKRLTIQSFTSSQYYLTKVQVYQLVPGPIYKGCVPVNKV